jgi:phospholipid/cholesterol/gamma-HCH transport system substrate-binding protein
MKMRASNLVVGSATLVVIAAAFAGLLGIRKYHSIRQQSPLRIVFEGSASGLRKGGVVNFDGIQVGQVKSLKLESPRRIVALVTVDNSAPLRKDTIVGLEFQGLTGIAAISLTGGEAAAPPVPLDKDGIPTLTADLSEEESVRETLHKVDQVLVDNQAALKNGLTNFEAYTASLTSKSDAIDSVFRKANDAFESFDRAMTRIDDLFPGIADGHTDELLHKVQSIRELAESFSKHSGTVMAEGRRSLNDISESAMNVIHKFDPNAVSGGPSTRGGPWQRRR